MHTKIAQNMALLMDTDHHSLWREPVLVGVATASRRWVQYEVAACPKPAWWDHHQGWLTEYSEFSLISHHFICQTFNPPQFASTNIRYMYQKISS